MRLTFITRRILLWLTLLAAAQSAALPPLAAETRTWRNEQGKKLDAELQGVEGEDVILVDPDKPKVTLKYPLNLLGDKDREYVEGWRANRESMIGKLVWGNLVKAKETEKAKAKKKKKHGDDDEDEDAKAKEKEKQKDKEAAAGEDKSDDLFKPMTKVPSTKIKYYVLYFSGKWTPYDRAFTPKLADLYRDRGPKNDKSTVGAGRSWEVILISADRNAAALAEYMNDFDMPWPAMDYEKGLHSPLVRFRGPGLPCLVVVDPEGKVLVDTFKDHEYRGPEAALEDFKKLLADGPEAESKESKPKKPKDEIKEND